MRKQTITAQFDSANHASLTRRNAIKRDTGNDGRFATKTVPARKDRSHKHRNRMFEGGDDY